MRIGRNPSDLDIVFDNIAELYKHTGKLDLAKASIVERANGILSSKLKKS